AALNIHQAKGDFDAQQADSARAAEAQTLSRIDGERAALADIEQRMRDNNCGSAQSSGGGTTNTTAATASSQSTKANAAAPVGFQAAQFQAAEYQVAGATTTTTTKKTTSTS